jgi:hypothetical protein
VEAPSSGFQFIPHGPGPPQRPHIPGCEEEGFDSEATAKTLRLRAVSSEPHSGHLTPALELIVFTSFSNWFLQDLQVYS